MALQIYGAGDFVPDPGGNDRVYPIPDPLEKQHEEILYDQKIQRISYLTANLVSVFNEWFCSFFEPNYFKFVRIKTQSTIQQFKAFMMDIYKKDKPFLVIDPRPIEMVEDTIFTQNMLNRYNFVDPSFDPTGMKLMYSLPIMESDLFELVYRRNQYKVDFDIMIMEQTINRQLDTYNMMIMNMRHNSKFMLYRNVPMLIPSLYIRNIANFHGMKWDSEEFLDYMNSISLYPIIRRAMPTGQIMFYMDYDLHIRVESNGFPARDSAENADAIEWGARVVDSFTFSAIMPAEYVFLTKHEHVGKFDRGIPEDPDSITYISPIYTDLPWPTELGEYKLANRIDIELQEGDEKSMDILQFLRGGNEDIYSTVMEWVEHKLKLSDLVQVRVYPNGSMKETGTILHDNGILELCAPEMNKLYTMNIYVNLRTINLVRDGGIKKWIGTIEKY